MPQLEQTLLDVLREHTAGDPMRPEVRWTNRSLKEMSRRLAEKGTPASQRVLRPLLKRLGFVKRKAHKTLAMGDHSHRHVFKEALQRLADRLGIEIRVAHDPPYGSKYNPIEHRVFPHGTRACQGVVFESVELVSDLISRTHTQTGLTVTTSIWDRVFETGCQVATDFLETGRILRDTLLPKWNYRALPIPSS